MEFCSRNASFRSSSAIFLSRSISSCRSLSTSRLRRSFSRSSCSGFNGSSSRVWRRDALKHIHCQVFQPISRSKHKILKDFCDTTFAGRELLRGIRYSGIVTVFLRLVRAMGIHPGPGKPGPRIHDLRHGFAIRVLDSCSGDRTVVDANMLALMTYMGHGQVDSTYWYIHATPHMLAQVSEMSEAFGEGGQS